MVPKRAYVNSTGQYIGAAALAAYRSEFVGQSDAAYVPVEQGGGPGAADCPLERQPTGGAGPTGIVDTHGRDMEYELMVPWMHIESPSSVFISQTTIHQFEDLGYTVVKLPGDANGDGFVDGADLDIVLSNYNRTGATWAQGDFNGDGVVNGQDLERRALELQPEQRHLRHVWPRRQRRQFRHNGRARAGYAEHVGPRRGGRLGVDGPAKPAVGGVLSFPRSAWERTMRTLCVRSLAWLGRGGAGQRGRLAIGGTRLVERNLGLQGFDQRRLFLPCGEVEGLARRFDGLGEASRFGVGGGERVEKLRFLAPREFDGAPGQLDRFRAVANGGVRISRQCPGRQRSAGQCPGDVCGAIHAAQPRRSGSAPNGTRRPGGCCGLEYSRD